MILVIHKDETLTQQICRLFYPLFVQRCKITVSTTRKSVTNSITNGGVKGNLVKTEAITNNYVRSIESISDKVSDLIQIVEQFVQAPILDFQQ